VVAPLNVAADEDTAAAAGADLLGMVTISGVSSTKCQNEMSALSSGSVLYIRCDRRAAGYTLYLPWHHSVETVNTPKLPATGREYIGLLPG